jgi:2,3-bisphosphoglycerate-dependent phosphoglycerate mutase
VRFIVIRHGQSTNNLLWEQTGNESGRHPDTPLTETGHIQARRLGEALASGVLPWSIDVLYCSLMKRAVQTAAPIAAALEMPVTGHLDMFEVGGPFDVDEATGTKSPYPGAPRSELLEVSERLVLPESVTDDGWYTRRVEEPEEATQRARALIANLRATHSDDTTVAFVSHGYFSQYLFREMLGIVDMPGWVEMHNTSLTMYEDRPLFASTRAVRTDWMPHLPEELVTT